MNWRLLRCGSNDTQQARNVFNSWIFAQSQSVRVTTWGHALVGTVLWLADAPQLLFTRRTAHTWHAWTASNPHMNWICDHMSLCDEHYYIAASQYCVYVRLSYKLTMVCSYVCAHLCIKIHNKRLNISKLNFMRFELPFGWIRKPSIWVHLNAHIIIIRKIPSASSHSFSSFIKKN